MVSVTAGGWMVTVLLTVNRTVSVAVTVTKAVADCYQGVNNPARSVSQLHVSRTGTMVGRVVVVVRSLVVVAFTETRLC